MVFQVGLVDGIESVMVKHRIHARVVGIVARADGVDVVLFHQCHVAKHRFGAHGTAVKGVAVVAVHAFEHHPLAVDVEQ